MSVQPLTNTLTGPQPDAPIPVQVSLIDGKPAVNHDPVNVPWRYNGTIVWSIADPATGTFDIAKGGIVFFPDAPFTRIALTETVCVYRAINDNLEETGPFAYSIFVDTPSGKVVKHDPTVENDSPPPIGITQ